MGCVVSLFCCYFLLEDVPLGRVIRCGGVEMWRRNRFITLRRVEGVCVYGRRGGWGGGGPVGLGQTLAQ